MGPVAGVLRRTLFLLWFEGAFSGAYDTLVGPVYMSGLAGEVGVSVMMVTLLTSVPWIGQIGQVIGTLLFSNARSMKRVTLVLAILARSLWLIPMVLGVVWGLRDFRGEGAFPVSTWFFVAAMVACAASLFGSTSGVAWNSWMTAIVPERFRGRFFGVKQRFGMASLVLANLLAAVWVGWKPGGYHLGILILGVIAVSCAAVSTLLLSKVPPEPAPSPTSLPLPAADTERPGWRETIRGLEVPLQDRRFLRTLVFGATFQGSLLIAGPYFPYFYTKELAIPMGAVALWTMLNNVSAFIAAAWWGRRIDRVGLKFALLGGGTLMALSPLPYCLPAATVAVIGPFEYFLNGFAWSGQSLALSVLLFQKCPKEHNAAYFSLYAAASGGVGALSVFLGGQLASALMPIGGFRALWVIAAVLRFTVLWTLGRAVLEEERASDRRAATRVEVLE